MTVTPGDYELAPGEFAHPVLWLVQTGVTAQVDVSDEVMDRYLGPGDGGAIKSFGHDEQTGVHFLLTRKGTAVHTDRAYLRYTHQFVLRNDGNRVRGLPKYDSERSWHAPMEAGTLYCLDTHSPHQGLADPRFADRAATRGMKAVVAVDRSVPLDPPDALALIQTYLARQLEEFSFDPTAKFKKWKEPKRG
jgi:hypothetical protein